MNTVPEFRLLRLTAIALGAQVTLVSALAATWDPVMCVPADLPPEALFERVRLVDDFEGAATHWKAVAGGQNAKASAQLDGTERHCGEGSLRIDYEFVGKKDFEYIQVEGAAEFAAPGLGFGFWLKHDGTPFRLHVRFVDAGGEWHQTDLLAATQAGWQFVAGAADAPSLAWGGDGNRRKDYPLRLGGICIDRPQVGFVGRGSAWIDDAEVVRQTSAGNRPLQVEVQGRRFGHVYSVGDAVVLKVKGEGERVRWSFLDFWGRERAGGEGVGAGIEAAFTFRETGWFVGKLELLTGGRVVGTHLFPCAALPGGEEPARSEFFGVCSHYGQNAYPLETMELMRRYGIDQFRDEISWRSYEREKGRLALPAYAAAYLKRAAELKLRPLIIYDYNNPHYDGGGFPNSAEAIAAFAAYAVDLTRQTQGLVNQFEVWNEWVGGCGMNGQPGVHDGESYGRLLRPTYDAVKRAFPDVTVVGIGGEYGAKCADHVLGAIRTAGPDAMDAWSIHPYRYPRSPEASDLVGEVQAIAAKVAGAGAKTRAWITEIGYPTHRTSGGSDLAAQARHCVRTVALLQALPEVGKVFWYDFKDDGLSREDNEHNFGLVHHQRFHCAPKPGIVAASVFIRMTAGASPLGVTQEGQVYAATYRRPDQSNVVVAWSVKGPVQVTWEGEVQLACDLMGAPLLAGPTMELTENPVYLAGRDLRLKSR